ncbi:MAG: lipoyl(octanoyl) transferase LipB [Methylophilales bacterium]|jgi:lipoyl(octanoyl) transferase|nr:lipoyl(octanoyl) transferase LipB [Pseudomonadota bacterium]NQW34563.1 lipoyl(octanoyl) transferase LipB [Methylophilales bacterium]HCK03990.1 octanoyltransferase [Methylophilaceae bacterium]
MDLIIKNLGATPYEETWQMMKDYIAHNPSQDEIWITEHPAIFTTGLNKKDIKIPDSDIPHVFVDRGGKITYHGPGQVIVYLLINLLKNQLTIRQLVSIIEKSIIELLIKNNIKGHSKKEAPGVYVLEKKIASIGLRIKNNFTYHGLSLNVAMDLSPFLLISPCGIDNLEMTQVSDLNKDYNNSEIISELTKLLQFNLSMHHE